MNKNNNQINNKYSKNSWSKEWELVFQNQEWGKYPPEELIRFTARNFYKISKSRKIKFLDLGCGTGACTWYLAREGMSVFGIDGSKTAINKAIMRFKKEHLKGNFQVMDYIKMNFQDNTFDVVIDICSIQHNPIENIREILNEVNRVLKPGGKFFSMIVSHGTYFKPYENKGYIHFYKLAEIKKLFNQFDVLSIEKSERTENNRMNKISHWIITCEKVSSHQNI